MHSKKRNPQRHHKPTMLHGTEPRQHCPFSVICYLFAAGHRNISLPDTSWGTTSSRLSFPHDSHVCSRLTASFLYWPTHLGFPSGSVVRGSACQCLRRRLDLWEGRIHWRRKWQPTPVSHGEVSLEKEMATYSSILAREIPWAEELGCYSPWGHQRVGHDLATEQQQQQDIQAI